MLFTTILTNRSIWHSFMLPLRKSNRKPFMNKILLIMVMIILSGTAVFAEMRGPGMGMGMRYGYGLGACGDAELHLNQDQAAKVRILQLNYLKKIRMLQRELMIKRAELKVMDSSPAEDISRLNRQRLEIQELREKMRE